MRITSYQATLEAGSDDHVRRRRRLWRSPVGTVPGDRRRADFGARRAKEQAPENAEKGPPGWPLFRSIVRRRPTLPHPVGCSTIGAGWLNFRVRDGSGCFPAAMAAVTL